MLNAIKNSGEKGKHNWNNLEQKNRRSTLQFTEF